MVPGASFMVAEFPADGMPFGEFTKQTPGATVDILSEPPVTEGDDRIHPSLVLVKGASSLGLDRLLHQVEKAYGPCHTLRHERRTGTWLGRVHLRESTMRRNAGIRALTELASRCGIPWSHHEAGVLHIRARILDPRAPADLLREAQAILARSGVEAQVDIQEVGTRDFSVWNDLVRHTLGLSS